jgi:hypothetical protein
MEKVVALERQVLEQFEARCGAFGHRDGDGAIQLHDGRGLESGELSVERCDLAPVGVLGPLRLRMQGRDRSLKLVGARLTQEERAVEERDAAVDQVAVPCRPVLILEQHERSIRADARLGARRLQEQERLESEHLWLVGHQRRQDAAEADRLGHQVGPREIGSGRRAVALVEDEVDHGERSAEPVRQEVVRRDAVRDAGAPDLPLRAHEPLREGLLRHEEGAGDLRRRQPAHQTQRQRDLRVRRERRMAAREEER